ncbi:MAG: hypothetical protein ABJA67_05465 [Chthonomonadales bacterium]
MRRFSKTSLIVTVVSVGIASISIPTFAKFARNWAPVPFERIIPNLQKYVSDHPNDAKGHYTLGRIYSCAFATNDKNINLVTKDWHDDKPLPLPHFVRDETAIGMHLTVSGKEKGRAVSLLKKSISEYREAIRLDPKNGLYRLGYAWDLEQGANLVPEIGPPPGTKLSIPTSLDWKKAAIVAYRDAYNLAIQSDYTKSDHMNMGDEFVSGEAADNYISLSGTPKTEQERVVQAMMRATVTEIRKHPNIVTPIIFPLTSTTRLADLTSNHRLVDFDLSVLGTQNKWQWVNATAGILVWDPLHTGRIMNGAQLFGSRTWQMFWKTGYDALAALDDNNDGWLTGKELKGIAVWCDRNGNGKSDKGEVVSFASLGVVAISVKSDGMLEGVAGHSGGVKFADGTTHPSFDWTPTGFPVVTKVSTVEEIGMYE